MAAKKKAVGAGEKPSGLVEQVGKVGRPTAMTQEIADTILSKMAEGLSLAAAAAECDVHRQRVYEWEAKNEEFADTIKMGRSKRQAFLERRLLSASDGPVVTSSIFALKNAAGDDWRDKTEVAQTTRVEPVSADQMAEEMSQSPSLRKEIEEMLIKAAK